MHASLCISLPVEGGEKCYGMLKNADSGSVLAKKKWVSEVVSRFFCIFVPGIN